MWQHMFSVPVMRTVWMTLDPRKKVKRDTVHPYHNVPRNADPNLHTNHDISFTFAYTQRNNYFQRPLKQSLKRNNVTSMALPTL
jgi:hypothetical protein